MLKNKIFSNKVTRNSELKGITDETLKVIIEEKVKKTPGEMLRDSIIEHSLNATEAATKAAEAAAQATAQATMEGATQAAYKAGNMTEKVVTLADKAGVTVDRGIELGFGGESASSLGRVAFKTTKDIARGDSVCTGLCLVSGTCEAIALCCSTVKIIPCRGRIYVGAKIISRGCIAFRNACAGEGC